MFLILIYFWERERERQSVSRGGAETEGHRIQSRLQALSCQHKARHGAQTHKLWDHDLSSSRTLNQLSHPGAPVTWNIVSIYEDSENKEVATKKKKNLIQEPGCLSRLNKHLTSGQVMISQSVNLSPTSGSVLTAQSLEPALGSMSLSLSALPPLMLCLSICLSLKNKYF